MTSVRVLAAAMIVAAAAALTGCSAGTGGSSAGPSAAPTTPAATGASASPSAAPTAPVGTGSSAAPTPSGSSDALRSDRCTASALTASLAQGGAAAGSIMPSLVLTNTGPQRCTLQGFPGVSFVGDGTGTQIGAAGTFETSSPHGTVTLDPGKTAHAPLRIARAENYPAETCQPVPADGLRVYPPGSTQALFVATSGLTACRSTQVQLIFVQGLLPGS